MVSFCRSVGRAGPNMFQPRLAFRGNAMARARLVPCVDMGVWVCQTVGVESPVRFLPSCRKHHLPRIDTERRSFSISRNHQPMTKMAASQKTCLPNMNQRLKDMDL